MNKFCIGKVTITYCRAITQNLLCIINDRLVDLEPVTVSINNFCRIVVSFPLQRVICDCIHASTITGHMGNTKGYIA